MGIRDMYNGVRNYFSRDRTEQPVINDERGRNAQVGYLQRRTWFDKTLDFFGTVGKYLGFGAIALTGVGAVALGVQYIRGQWPYRDVRDNEYVITQNTITEKPARPLKHGVNAFVRPFVRVVEENGKPVTVTGKIQSEETPDFEYRSRDDLVVKLKTQYNFQVTTPEGAAQVYWDYGGMRKAKETLDNIVENALMNELALVDSKNIAKEVRYAKEGEMIRKDGQYRPAKENEPVNYLVQAEHNANEILKKERIGISVTNFSISNPRYSDRIEKAWEDPIVAQNEALARDTRAQSLRKEAQTLADSTMEIMTGRYLPAAQALAIASGNQERTGDYAINMWNGDNGQQIAMNSKGRTVYIQGGLGTPVTIQNVGQATRSLSGSS